MSNQGDMNEMMARWMEVASPGKMHAFFEEHVGSWKTTTRMWGCGPEGDVSVTEGSAEISLILGGRFLLQKTVGEAMEGLGILGYDNFKQKYVSLWVDSMNTHALFFTGDGDPEGRRIELFGTFDEAMTGAREQPIRSLSTLVGKNEMLFEFFTTPAQGEEFRVMEVTYVRA